MKKDSVDHPCARQSGTFLYNFPSKEGTTESGEIITKRREIKAESGNYRGINFFFSLSDLFFNSLSDPFQSHEIKQVTFYLLETSPVGLLSLMTYE